MHLIKTTFRIVTLSSLVVAGVIGSVAQQARPTAKNSNAETGLVGVKLFDPGSKVIRLYGSPDEIQAIGTAGTGAAGGGGNGGGGASGGSGGSDGSRGTRSADDLKTSRETLIGDPFGVGEGDWEIRQLRPNDGGGAGSPEAGGREGGGSRDTGGGGAGSAGGTGGGERTIFTRWVYKRSTGKYSFVFDKANRVIQIESVGIKDSKVRTRRGVTYGAFFGDLINKYGAPDAYEISGTNLVVRFLVKDRVAFRLTKLDPKGKQRVSGIVIAAGKE